MGGLARGFVKGTGILGGTLWLILVFCVASPEAAWLGVEVQDRTLDVGGRRTAAVVTSVTPGGPAAKAGLQPGDIILVIDGESIGAAEDVADTLADLAPGTRVSIEFLRSGLRRSLAVTLATPPAGTSQKSGSTGVLINGKLVTAEQLRELQATYGAVPPPGRYWYDARSGLYGMWGREAAGVIRPGHRLGPVPAGASSGNTRVFINGRELNLIEAAYFEQVFGAIYQGRWWLDGATGNLGLEGSPMPIANFVLALQQRQQQQSSQAGGGYRWRDGRGSYGGVEGNCVFGSFKGGGSVMSSGC
ncbi:MAG: PDZ domain-containing protein [Dehalococcoidia bacterium]|nr:PDZ domain-containing protein [Dehalococcoidia bacterium]